MEYTASLVSKPFWYQESRITAEYIDKGLSRAAIRELAVKENIYQYQEEYRAVEAFSTTYRRLTTLPPALISKVATGDTSTAKFLLIVAIMKIDQLFAEFLAEVYYNKLMLMDYFIEKRNLMEFFAYKSTQSEKVANWSARVQQKLQAAYMKLLSDAGIATPEKDSWKLTLPLVSNEIQTLMRENGLKEQLNILTGGAE